YIGPFALGTGGYGTVLGFESNSTDRTKDVAVKRFNTPFESAKRAQRCFREIQLLRDLAHENIVKIKFAYTTDGSCDQLSSVYLAMEFAGHDLRIRLAQETQTNHRFSLLSFQKMISELLRALKYLNSAKVIHRDLKPDNLAISDDGKLTLLDFGIARVMGKKEMTQGPGHGYYRAIETIAFDQANDRQVYNEKADIWSIGAILCEMITGRILFKAIPPQKDNPAVTAICICGPIPDIVIDQQVDHEPSRRYLREKSRSAVRRNFLEYFEKDGREWLKREVRQNGRQLVDFIDRTLDFDHTQRMDVDEALAHPFLEGVRMQRKEVDSRDVIYDFDDRKMEEWKKLIWEVIQASPVNLD
ncbi:hypothetical protein PMAYCL1PPCAC_15574, partial [Pristionchus mayeri]